MYGGPAKPKTNEKTFDRDPVGDYKLTHRMAEISEKLMSTPDQVVELEAPCPACGGPLAGKANPYSRTISIWCLNCTFRINR